MENKNATFYDPAIWTNWGVVSTLDGTWIRYSGRNEREDCVYNFSSRGLGEIFLNRLSNSYTCPICGRKAFLISIEYYKTGKAVFRHLT